MKSEAYTPETICRCLSVGDFCPPKGTGQSRAGLHILMCPSFYPEISLNIREDASSLTLTATVAANQIWSLPHPVPVAVHRATGGLAELTFAQLDMGFRVAIGSAPIPGTTLDGMPVHAVLFRSGAVVSVSTNPGSQSELGRFFASVLVECHRSLDDTKVRNGLARAGVHLGVDLDLEPEFDPKPVSRLTVFGGLDHQREVMAALAAISATRKEPGP